MNEPLKIWATDEDLYLVVNYMQNKMEAVVIDVYDQDGEKLNSMLMTADWHEVLKKMQEIIDEDGLPVVRRAGHVRFEAAGSLSVEADKTVNPITKDWAPGLSFRIKIGNVEFDVSGQPNESKKMYERILEDWPRMFKMVNSDVEEVQNALNEIKSLMSALK